MIADAILNLSTFQKSISHAPSLSLGYWVSAVRLSYLLAKELESASTCGDAPPSVFFSVSFWACSLLRHHILVEAVGVVDVRLEVWRMLVSYRLVRLGNLEVSACN